MNNPNSRTVLSIIAWTVTLFASLLPDIVFRQFTGNLPTWLFWSKAGVLCAGLLASLLLEKLHPLRLFFAVVLLVHLLAWGVDWAYKGVNYASWLGGASPFVQEVGKTQITRFTTALLGIVKNSSFR